MSGTYRNMARLGLLGIAVYLAEKGLVAYLSSVYEVPLALPGGHAFLAPFLLVFGAYLLSKGADRPVQLLFLGLGATLSIGDAAYLVLSQRLDAAAATASLLASAFMLAVSYTFLGARRPVRPSL